MKRKKISLLFSVDECVMTQPFTFFFFQVHFSLPLLSITEWFDPLLVTMTSSSDSSSSHSTGSPLLHPTALMAQKISDVISTAVAVCQKRTSLAKIIEMVREAFFLSNSFLLLAYLFYFSLSFFFSDHVQSVAFLQRRSASREYASRATWPDQLRSFRVSKLIA